MRINNVSVRYTRTRQPAKYEEAGGMVEFSAVLEEGVEADADYLGVAKRLYGEAKTIVLAELALVAPGASASVHTAGPVVTDPPSTAKTPAPPPKKPTKAEKEAAAAAAAAAAAQTAGEIPTGDAKPAATAAVGDIPTGETSLGRQLPAAQTAPAATAAVGDIPTDGATSTAPKPATPAQVVASGGEALTASAVQKYITTQLVAKKFLPNVILGKLKSDYKVDRVQDLPADKLAEFHAWVKGIAGE